MTMKTLSDYTIYCTEKQTKMALELGASIKTTSKEPSMFFYAAHPKTFISKGIKNANKEFTCAIPTTEQMIGWLEKHGFNFELTKTYTVLEHDKIGTMGFYEGTRKESTLIAIDSALEYLKNHKN